MCTYVFLADGFEETEALMSTDILRRGDVPTHLVGVTGTHIRGSRGIRVLADVDITDIAVKEEDVLLFPGGSPGAQNLANSKRCVDLLLQHHAHKGVLAAICAAPVELLYPNGLLQGRKFTCFPALAHHVRDAHFIADSPVVQDGNIVTSQGLGTTGQFAIYLLQKIMGIDIAKKVWDSSLLSTSISYDMEQFA